MKAVLICPGERRDVAALAEYAPLSNLRLVGKTLLEHWLDFLAERKASEVLVLATDRPEQARALAGDGSRWGLRVTVLPEIRELTVIEARRRYRGREADADWLPAPDDISLMDALPGHREQPLFANYAGWMAAAVREIPRAAKSNQLGVREIQPGVWAGLHARISTEAQLRAPCWIGENVFVGAHAVIGPAAILERGAFVERGSDVAHAIIGAETFVGENTEVHHSIALGSSLINWKVNSVIKVSEPFLLCSLAGREPAFKRVGMLSRLAALAALALTTPPAVFLMLRAKMRGLRAFRPLLAVRSQGCNTPVVAGETIVYHELAQSRGCLRRWPQLWSIVRGQFAWVGNRPISPLQAARFKNDFERLWLSSRCGLISLSDTETGCDPRSEQSRAESAYYATHANWRLDWKIFFRATFLVVLGVSVTRVRDAASRLLHFFTEGKVALK